MSLNAIRMTAKGALRVLRHYAPEILAVSGAASVAVGIVGVAKETYSASEIIAKHKEEREKIAEAAEIAAEEPEKYPFDEKREIIKLYCTTAVKMARKYAVPVSLIVYGLTAMLGGVFILRRRNAVIMSAYTALSQAFNEYRARIREEMGDEFDRDIMTGAKHEEVEVEYTDEKGKKKKKKESIKVVDPKNNISPYSVWYGEFAPNDPNYNPEFVKPAPDDSNISYAMAYNMNRLIQLEKYLNDQLIIEGELTWADARRQLGFTHKTESSHFVGWSTDPKLKGIVADHVDLGLTTEYNQRAAGGYEPIILINPNCAQIFGFEDKSKAILPMY